jgi:ABC-2 type transport system ATP-binding protein
MALAKQPSLLILDEPAAALDPLARREFMADLAKAAAERSLSVLLSSHLIEDLERACDYLIVLANGRVQVAGRVPDLLAAQQPASVQELVLGYLSRARGNGETEVAR